MEELNEGDLHFLSKHLAKGTLAGYSYAFKHFSSFCSSLGADPVTCPPPVIVKYSRKMYEDGAEYSTINHHRSAISKFHQGFDGSHLECILW